MEEEDHTIHNGVHPLWISAVNSTSYSAFRHRAPGAATGRAHRAGSSRAFAEGSRRSWAQHQGCCSTASISCTLNARSSFLSRDHAGGTAWRFAEGRQRRRAGIRRSEAPVRSAATDHRGSAWQDARDPTEIARRAVSEGGEKRRFYPTTISSTVQAVSSRAAGCRQTRQPRWPEKSPRSTQFSRRGVFPTTDPVTRSDPLETKVLSEIQPGPRSTSDRV